MSWCKEERNKIIKENPLKEVELTEEEYVMAKFYYYDGMTWEFAFGKMVRYLDLTVYDKCSHDEMGRCVNRLKKYITRKVQKYSRIGYYGKFIGKSNTARYSCGEESMKKLQDISKIDEDIEQIKMQKRDIYWKCQDFIYDELYGDNEKVPVLGLPDARTQKEEKVLHICCN